MSDVCLAKQPESCTARGERLHSGKGPGSGRRQVLDVAGIPFRGMVCKAFYAVIFSKSSHTSVQGMGRVAVNVKPLSVEGIEPSCITDILALVLSDNSSMFGDDAPATTNHQ
jgi:hypothetical protein